MLKTLEKLPVNYRLFESLKREEISSSRLSVARGSGRRSRTASETSISSANVTWTPDKLRKQGPTQLRSVNTSFVSSVYVTWTQAIVVSRAPRSSGHLIPPLSSSTSCGPLTLASSGQ